MRTFHPLSSLLGRRPRGLFILAFFAAFFALPPLHAAAEQGRVSTRSQAMQGGIAAPWDNAAVYLNPAGTVLNPRYEFTGYGELETGVRDRTLALSIVDSVTIGELGGGVAWRRDTGGRLPRDDYAFAMAQHYPGNSAVGLAVRYRVDRERERRSDWNLDLGGVYDAFEGLVKAGAVVQNIFSPPEGAEDVMRRFSGGLGSLLFGVAQITADLGYTPELADTGFAYDWSVGAEVFLAERFALRGGYGQVPQEGAPRTQWSVGAGVIEPGAFGVGYALTQPIAEGGTSHALELTVFLFN
jgi:hypothetical protein